MGQRELPPGWYEAMERAARYVVSSNLGYSSDMDAGDLIGEAWLNWIERLPEDSSPGTVFCCSMKAMKRCMFGRRISKRRQVFGMDCRTVSMTPPAGTDGETEWLDRHAESPERFSYDDVDELLHFLARYSERDKAIIIDRVSGMTQREIGEKHGVSESRISQMLSHVSPQLKNIRAHAL